MTTTDAEPLVKSAGIFEQVTSGLGLTARPQQAALVNRMREACMSDDVALTQAGTGTGKSYAVLSVALEQARLNKSPSVIICPTNSLINQYVEKDAPKIAKITGAKIEYLKGRSNYLCTSSYAMSQLADPVKEFNRLTADGRIEWAHHASLDATWGCSGDCDPKMGDLCGLQVARAKAQSAEVVITNGHLLVWDQRVSDFTQGQVRLLPFYSCLFVDECHALEQVGRDVLSDRIGWNSGVYDAIPELRKWILGYSRQLDDRNREISIQGDAKLAAMVSDAKEEIRQIEYRIRELFENLSEGEKPDKSLLKEYKRELKAYQRFVDFADQEDDRFISLIQLELSKDGQWEPALHRRCVDASGLFRQILTSQPSMLVSGTVPQSLAKRLGVSDATLEDVGTPFDYTRCTLAISGYRGNDRNVEHLRDQEIVAAVNDMAGRPHADGGGGTLILFTSWERMERVMPLVAHGLKYDVPVLMQSRTDPRDTADCIEVLRTHGHAVMGGVQTCWTGLDIPGNALRQVIIDRLPWGVPTLEVKAIEKIHGRQPYVDAMLTLLTQGIGRLVRTVEDDGRVYIADSRAKSQRWQSSTLTRHIAQFSNHRRR